MRRRSVSRTRAAGSRSQNDRAFWTCSIVSWASWTDLGLRQLLAPTSGSPSRSAARTLRPALSHPAQRRIGVAPALDELQPLGPMARHLPPDRLDRRLDLPGLAEERGDALDPAQQDASDPRRSSSRTLLVPIGSAIQGSCLGGARRRASPARPGTARSAGRAW